MSLSAFLNLLERLPGSYAGPRPSGTPRPDPGPYAVVGVGEGTLAAALCAPLVPQSLARGGTQFVLSSPDARAAATDYGDLAEVAGATTRRVSTGGTPDEVDVLVPGGPLSTYHFAQFVAHASAHADDADEAERVLAGVRDLCAPHVEDGNPARDLAWKLWGRTPLLLAAPDAEALLPAWQALLARTGKTLAVPLLGDALPLTTGAFEAQHEKGDAKVALILGDADDTLNVAREVLETRIDEVIHVPFPVGTASGYAGMLGLWYLGAWVAAYLAERHGVDPADPPALTRAQAALSGDGDAEARLSAPRDDLRRERPAFPDLDGTPGDEDELEDLDPDDLDPDDDGR